jgi:hypothetical protein
MRGQFVSPLYFWIILAAVIVVLFLVGGVLSAQDFEVAGCRSEWSTNPKTVSSDLCPDPSQPCTAQPFAQQHNAQVDALVCACTKAAEGGAYPDQVLNTKIQDAFARASGFTLGIREICEAGGNGFMVKWRYG